MIHEGEVWFVKFPLEEDDTRFLPRPVAVIDVCGTRVLSVKITKHPPRDCLDIEIIFWQQANLRYPSTARVSQTIELEASDFDFKIGDLNPSDLAKILDLYMSM